MSITLKEENRHGYQLPSLPCSPPLKNQELGLTVSLAIIPCQSINCLSFPAIKRGNLIPYKLSLSPSTFFFDSWAFVEILPCDRRFRILRNSGSGVSHPCLFPNHHTHTVAPLNVVGLSQRNQRHDRWSTREDGYLSEMSR